MKDQPTSENQAVQDQRTTDQVPMGLITRLVEKVQDNLHTVMGSNSVQAWTISGFLCNCNKLLNYCDDKPFQLSEYFNSTLVIMSQNVSN